MSMAASRGLSQEMGHKTIQHVKIRRGGTTMAMGDDRSSQSVLPTSRIVRRGYYNRDNNEFA